MASLTKNTQNEIALMGVVLDNFMRPCGLRRVNASSHADSLAQSFQFFSDRPKSDHTKKPGRRVEGTSVVFAGCQTDFWGLG